MGARTDAARAAAVASRGTLEGEVVRLEASARAAVDIPAKIRRAPAKTAGLAAGAIFVAAGGPKRVIRRLVRAVRGPEADLPKSMLPKEVDKTLRKLGSDGDKVRGTIEREFADYLETNAPERRSRDLGATASALAGSVLGPVTKRVGRQLAEELFSPKTSGASSFEAAAQRARTRFAGLAAGRDGNGATPDGTPPPAGDAKPGAEKPKGRATRGRPSG
ncbi:MAG: hypothetical protein M3P84_08565 [Chloroflexota bacterium]|nr:hypothetical protein [Chloroflexota bacterium]